MTTEQLGFVAPVAHGPKCGVWLNARTREALIDKMIVHIGSARRRSTYDHAAHDRNINELRRQLNLIAA